MRTTRSVRGLIVLLLAVLALLFATDLCAQGRGGDAAAAQGVWQSV